ncbi:MAG: PEP-CTERM sorting domain-containing protein [Acidobacteriota bacterium]|nr:PEP-CTERM sorting domain-containing protein [Acidobacteriota bacterium]
MCKFFTVGAATFGLSRFYEYRQPSVYARLALCTLILTALLASAGSARAQADLTFSGGNNTPFVLTLNAPVRYAITANGANGISPLFIFQGVGDVFGGLFPGVSGTVSFSINGGSAQSITGENSGVTAGSLALNDIYMFGSFPGVAAGDIVTLTADTLTSNIAAAPPASGSFTTFIIDGNGTKISANGVSVVPEPATWATLLGGLGLLAGVQFFRRARKA